MARKIDGYVLVRGRAFPREGFHAFFRGGIRWPSDEPYMLALVTEPLLKVLRAERNIAIETDVDVPEDFDVSTLERFDVPPRTFVDPAAQALEESDRLDREIKAEKARLENAKKAAELARLRAEREAAEKGDVPKKTEKPKA